MLAKMIQAHDQLVDHLEQLNHDVDTKLADLARNHNNLFRSERELSVAVALSHEPLTREQCFRKPPGVHQMNLN